MKIVFDIGGTNMRVATVQGGELGEIMKVPTPQDPKEGVAILIQMARELAPSGIEAFGGGFPGAVRDGVVEEATHLPAWGGLNLQQEIYAAFGAPLRVLNDAIVVGLGEAQKGGGVGFSRVAYLTVSTGFGGSLIDESDVSKSLILGHDFPILKPRIESQISGTAIEKRFGIHPKDLDSLDERNKLADILAEGLSEIYTKWKPDVFVIGGSMIIGVNPIPLERVREKFAAVPVQMATLGDNGGLIGGMILASQS